MDGRDNKVSLLTKKEGKFTSIHAIENPPFQHSQNILISFHNQGFLFGGFLSISHYNQPIRSKKRGLINCLGSQNIAKTGSLCCVAARPHGSNAEAASTERPTSPHREPYWRTNTSFSPPPPRWDHRFQSEGIQYGSNDSIHLFGSTSSTSKESRSWMRGGGPSATEAGSPSDISVIQPWTPPPTQRVNIDDFETSSKRGAKSGPLCFTPTMEGTSMVLNSRGSTSSRSDYSEFEHSGKLHLSTPRNFPSRRSFMSKPIHPLSFPAESPTLEPSLENDSFTLQRDSHRLSSGSSSVDLADIADHFHSDPLTKPSYYPSEGHKCGVCDRLLSQRSPWSSRRIVKSGDMPVSGVLFCGHVFHAECLEQTTPKSHRSDPPCPICAKIEGESSNSSEKAEKCVFLGTRNGFPILRGFSEGGSSRGWSCAQVGDCVEGSMLLTRNKMKKNLALKGHVTHVGGKDFIGKAKKNGSYPINFFGRRFVDHEAGGCSKTSDN